MPTSKFQCRHIFPDGHRCGSPCLRKEPFCYYHHTARAPKTRAAYTDTHSLFELPDLEDRSSIQSAITLVLQRLAQGNLDTKRAGLLLYGLQIASANLPRHMNPSVKPVEDLIEDDLHGPIAPESQIDTSMVDALSTVIAHRLGLPIQAVADEATPASRPSGGLEWPIPDPCLHKSRLKSHPLNTLRQNRPRVPQPEQSAVSSPLLSAAQPVPPAPSAFRPAD